MRHASVFWLAAGGALAACSQIVGAEFDGLEPLDASSGGSVAGSAGAAGSSGNSSGGAMSSGGSSAGKGGSGGGGAGKGGSSGNAGTAGSAGNTQSGGSGGSAGSGGVGGGDAGGAGTGGAGAGGAGAGGGGAGGGGQCPGAGGVSGETGIVLNEIKGQGPGDDYIEIFNRSSDPVDISGYYVSDDSNNRVTFLAGTVICGQSYVLVLLQQTSSGGPHSCLGFSPCFWGMGWGVAAGGEDVFLRDPGNTELDHIFYPGTSEAHGRLTDGAEALGAITRSPGMPNQQL